MENEETTGGDVVDSEENLEDNPLFVALSNDEPDESELNEEETELEEFEPEEGDSQAVLSTKLKAKSRLLHSREKAIKRIKAENKALQEQIAQGSNGVTRDELATMIQSQGGAQESADDARATLIEELKERFEDDPSAVIDIMMQREAAGDQKWADVLERRDSFLSARLAPQHEISPRVQKVMNSLKSLPEYQGWSDNQMETAAKGYLSLEKRSSRRPPASIGKGGKLPLNATTADVEANNKSALEAMGYEL